VDVYNEETVSTREALSHDRILSEYVQTRTEAPEFAPTYLATRAINPKGEQ
jgi:hypothetical protein